MIEFGRLAVDPAGWTADCDGVPLSLTRREFSLLEALLANRTRIMPKERLFDRMFSMDEEEVGLNAIETYVARLRRKLEGSGVNRTLRGLGYQLVRVESAAVGPQFGSSACQVLAAALRDGLKMGSGGAASGPLSAP